MFGDSKRYRIIYIGGIFDTEAMAQTCIRETATPLLYIFVEGDGILCGPVPEGRTTHSCMAHKNSRHPVQYL